MSYRSKKTSLRLPKSNVFGKSVIARTHVSSIEATLELNDAPTSASSKDISVSLTSIVKELDMNGIKLSHTVRGVHGMQIYCLSNLKNTQKFFTILNSHLESTEIGSSSSLKVIGLDTETDTRRNRTPMTDYPSTIQICFGEGLVAIIQIYTICITQKELFPPLLKEFLENKSIIKAGVALSRDSHGMQKMLGVEVANIIDLDAMGKKLNLPRVSLAALTYLYCDYILDKRKKFVFGRWDDFTLPKHLIQYAAYDAYFGQIIYGRMLSQPAKEISQEDLTKILKKK